MGDRNLYDRKWSRIGKGIRDSLIQSAEFARKSGETTQEPLPRHRIRWTNCPQVRPTEGELLISFHHKALRGSDMGAELLKRQPRKPPA